MNKFELNKFLKDFEKIVEKSGAKIISEAEDINKNYKLRREISKIEKEIRDDFISVGVLCYELYKMDKDFSLEDFKEKFQSIDQKKSLLKKVGSSKDQTEDFSEDEGIYFVKEKKDQRQNIKISKKLEEEEDEDLFSSYLNRKETEKTEICPYCGYKNPEYVAYCSHCGKKL